MGTAEGRRGLDDARLLKAALVGLGFVDGVDLHYAEYEGATHSEQAWSERVGPMLEWLFPAPASAPTQYVNIRSFSSASFSRIAGGASSAGLPCSSAAVMPRAVLDIPDR